MDIRQRICFNVFEQTEQRSTGVAAASRIVPVSVSGALAVRVIGIREG